MPRRRRSRRTYRRGRRRYKRGYKAASRGYRRIARIARRVAFSANELRWKDDWLSEQTIALAPTGWAHVRAFNDLQQGTTRRDRLGQKIYSLGYKYSFTFWNNLSTNVYIRLLALQPRNKNDWSLTTSDAYIFDTDGQAYPIASYTEPQVMITSLNKRRYRVLMDKVFSLQSTTGADARRNVVKRGYIKNRKILSWDNAISNATPDYQVFFLAFVSRCDSDGDGVSNAVEFSCLIRHHFKDI